MNALTVLSPREGSIFACICDTVVAPGDALPAVAQTDAAFAFDRLLAASPALNRLGLRALFAALELSPRIVGVEGGRLRRLDPRQRAEVLERLEATAAGAGIVKAARGIAHFSYYGDDGVMRALGYDPDAVIERAAEARR
jgi:hypothetical protein